MDFDLQKYRAHIAKKLMNNTAKTAIIDNVKKSGAMRRFNDVNVSPDISDHENESVDGGKMDYVKRLKESIGKKSKKPSENVEGGKFSFKKAFKSVGKTIEHTANDVGKTALKTGANLAGKDLGQYVYNGIKEAGKGFAEYAPAVAEDAGLAVESNPELLLLAAGLDPPKRKSTKKTISAKERSRLDLVKKLMERYNISLPEASKMIKDKNLKY